MTTPINPSELYLVEIVLGVIWFMAVRSKEIRVWHVVVIGVFFFEIGMTPVGYGVAWIINGILHMFLP
ncbi:hypothetical protein [Streptantibioticus ferralitis]|uniref:Uncharacterized protein n=1 Tax=Streptantibioticus ferralitis TaxID=236510 RepID=A0ABT5YVJ1_9ACTN|nr:hypothetical protein [Streptantibioticus ferralitis]MDF2255361.1 hypothetical protein [Streptantibioticus ferralitis]